MNAQLMLKDRRIVSEDTFVDMVVWLWHDVDNWRP